MNGVQKHEYVMDFKDFKFHNISVDLRKMNDCHDINILLYK